MNSDFQQHKHGLRSIKAKILLREVSGVYDHLFVNHDDNCPGMRLLKGSYLSSNVIAYANAHNVALSWEANFDRRLSETIRIEGETNTEMLRSLLLSVGYIVEIKPIVAPRRNRYIQSGPQTNTIYDLLVVRDQFKSKH